MALSATLLAKSRVSSRPLNMFPEKQLYMDPRLLIFLMLFALGGCAAFAPEPAAEATVAVPDNLPAERVLETPPPSPLPAFCEVLLQSLAETRPMLEDLDETLAAHTDRFEAALADLNQPAPEPRALVCPPNTGGALGEKEIIGAMEWLYMDPPGRHFRARVDSGTETSSLSASDIVELLVEEPELIPTAVEEFLRAYSPVTMARVATKDTMLGDREVKEGERIMLTFPAANRDPEMFDDPEDVIIDRQRNRHVAFGSGIHRCAGSNLARMEMTVAIEEFLKMVPDFELTDPDAVTWAGGQVRGPRHLPVRFPNRTPL